MRVDIVTPERQLMSGDVPSVQIPGAEGDMTIMANHAPMVTTLRPGIVTVDGSGEGSGEYVVTGGFAEISAEGASILAERAMPKGEVTRETLDAVVAEMEEAEKISEGDAATAMRQSINDIRELIKRMG